MLSKDHIQVPRRYRAFLEAGEGGYAFLAVSGREEPAVAGERMAVPAGMAGAAALEEVVYGNPLLLADWGELRVIYRTRRFMLVPDFVDTPELAESAFRAQYPEDTALPRADLLVDDWAPLGARLVYEVPADELSFLRRTFNNPPVRHPLTVLAGYFAGRRQAPTGNRMLVSAADTRADILVLGPRGVLAANTFPVSGTLDTAYFALSVRQMLGMPRRDELMLAGPARTRAALAPVMRRAVSFVIPAIEPPEVLAGPRQVRDIPFELKVAPVSDL